MNVCSVFRIHETDSTKQVQSFIIILSYATKEKDVFMWVTFTDAPIMKVHEKANMK